MSRTVVMRNDCTLNAVEDECEAKLSLCKISREMLHRKCAK